MISDIRYVVRSLRRRRGFALVTVLTLALGIGSATAIYSVVDWFLFRQVPVPENLYMVVQNAKDGQFNPGTWQDSFLAYRAQSAAFLDFGAATYVTGNVVVDREPVSTNIVAITQNFFKVLGVVPANGRDFVIGEDVDGRNQVVIVAPGFAKKYLGGVQEALGKKIRVDEEECTVVGVLKQDQRLPPYVGNSVFRPLVLHPNAATPWDPYLIVFGLAKTGVTRKQALDSLLAAKVDAPPAFAEWFKDANKPALMTVAETDRIYRPELYWMLVGAVGFLYAIACLNATNLMLVHVVGKQLETSIRLALGSGHWRILRLLLIEIVGLCLCGSLLGALIANWLIPVFTMAANYRNGGGPLVSWHLGVRTYYVLGGLSILTGMAIALIPGIRALRSNILAGLKTGGGAIGESPGLARMRGTFVIFQATFAVVLLVGAGLMIRTFQRLQDVKLGFDPSHRVKMQIGFPNGYPSESKERLALLNRLRDTLQRVPGVTSAAYSSESLLAQWEYSGLQLEGPDGTKLNASAVLVSPDFQQAGGLVLKEGRWLTANSKGEVVINASLARARFGNSDAIGQYLKPAETNQDKKGAVFLGWQVVGVVGDVRDNVRNRPSNKVYEPVDWSPQSATNFVVDLAGEPSGESLTQLRRAIFQFDPRIVTNAALPVLDQLKDQLRHERLTLAVLKVLSAIAILLTIVGLFSVLAYTVDRRMPEFGIRMALGATPANLVRLVMRRGMALTALGIALGIGGAMALTRYLQSLLFETPPNDPEVIAIVAGILILSAIAACALPAFRASRPDVSRLLKGE
jgi:putative ABC transport system permease protein